MTTDYETDFYAWSDEQAKLLRAGCYAALDIAHLAEEVCPWDRDVLLGDHWPALAPASDPKADS